MIRFLAPLALILLVADASGEEGSSLRVTPDIIRHEVLHRPARITASADIPPGVRAVFRVIGPLQDLEVFARGRVGGALWSSAGRRSHEDVPAVFLIQGWPRAARDEDLAAHALDWSALARTLLPPDADPTARRGFRDLVAMKTSAGLYSKNDSHTTTEGDCATVEFVLPLDAPPGRYRVDVHLLSGTEHLRRWERRVVLQRRESVTAFEDLARERDPFYALVAVLLALGVGVITGLMLGLGSKVP